MRLGGLALLVLLMTAARPIQEGSLSGTVTDGSGTALPGVSVSAVNTDDGRAYWAVTNDSGAFSFSSLPVGEYLIRATLEGFATRQSTATVAVTRMATIELRLDGLNPFETVTVSSDRGPSIARLEEPTWNAWEEELGELSFQPLKALRPFHRYQLALDLSAFVYEKENPGVFHRPAEAKLSEWFFRSERDRVTLEVLLLSDPSFLEPLEMGVSVMQVDLRRLRQGFGKEFKINRPVWEVFKKSPRPDFLFGRATPLKFLTKGRKGLTSIGVSIWHEGKPLDEFSIPVCISDSDDDTNCHGAARLDYSLGGAQVLALGSGVEQPDAALQFVRLDNKLASGVFRLRTWDRYSYTTWPILGNLDDLLKSAKDSLLPNFASNDAEGRLLQGRALFELLFPDEQTQARQAFLDYVVPYLDKRGAAPRLFVRLPDSEFRLSIPLGLMAVPTSSGDRFLGFAFRVETPLDWQDYQDSDKCLSRWVMALPQEGGQDIQNALGEFADWVGACDTSDCIDSMKRLVDWLQEGATEPEAMAMLVLAHHGKDALYVREPYKLFPSLIIHKFQRPSLVVLNACGSLSDGPISFVRQFNLKGFSTVIATAAEVDAVMAGVFFNTFAQVLSDNPKNGAQVSDAFLETLRRMKTRYNSRSLVYTLLGNGHLRLCAPAEKTRE